jgi:hypothetical protein
MSLAKHLIDEYNYNNVHDHIDSNHYVQYSFELVDFKLSMLFVVFS